MRVRWALLLAGLAAVPAAVADPAAPPLGCASAIIVEESTGRILFNKGAEVKRFPASTTKIMTAILLLEKCDLDDIVVAPADIDKVKPSSMHLFPAERVPVRDLLYALMLRSANDAAVAAAYHISGNLPAFAKLMNDRAKELGCTDTNFVTPSGLHDDLHVTTALDLTRIARHAMTIPMFREIVKTPKWELTRSSNLKDLVVESKNRLMKVDPTLEGIKTGYTNPAQSCFVGCATRNDMRLYTVVLHTKDWPKDTAALLNWGYKYFAKEEVVTPKQEFAKFPVVEGSKLEVAAIAGESLTTIASKSRHDLVFDAKPDGILRAPIKAGQPIGTLHVYDRNHSFSAKVPLLAAEEVLPPPKFKSLFAILGGGMFLGLYAGLRAKRKRIDADYR